MVLFSHKPFGRQREEKQEIIPCGQPRKVRFLKVDFSQQPNL